MSINVQKAKQAIHQISNLMMELKDIQSDITEACNVQSSECGIEKSQLRKMAKIHCTQTFDESKKKSEELYDDYDAIMNGDNNGET